MLTRLLLLLALIIGIATHTQAQDATDSTDVVTEATADTTAETEAPALPPAVLFRTGDFEEILKQARKEKKLVLIDFWAVWCKPCHRLDRLTFTDVPLGDYVNSRFIPYRVNIDDFAGMDLVDKYGVKAYPTMLVVSAEDGAMVHKMTGFYLPTYLQAELEKAVIYTAAQQKKKKRGK
jgi:thiol:disulfide interchange protein